MRREREAKAAGSAEARETSRVVALRLSSREVLFLLRRAAKRAKRSAWDVLVVESVVDVGVGAADEAAVSLSCDGAGSSTVDSVKRRLDDSASDSSSEGEGLRFSVDDMTAVVCDGMCGGRGRGKLKGKLVAHSRLKDVELQNFVIVEWVMTLSIFSSSVQGHHKLMQFTISDPKSKPGHRDSHQ